MSHNLLTVIVITYRNGDFLYDTLDSILKQDYKNYELIISEDGDSEFNKDRLVRYIEKYFNKISTKIIINEKNVGTVKNINNSMSYASGDYVKIIAGDDMFADNVFSQQIEFLEKNPNHYFVLGNTVQVDEHLNKICDAGFEVNNDKYIDYMNSKKKIKYIVQHSSLFAIQSVCFRKSFFNKYGLFDETYLYVEDIPLFSKIAVQNISFGHINIPTVLHRNSGISSSLVFFDSSRIKYYQDLKTFYDRCSLNKEEIGEHFRKMKYKLFDYRIKMCLLNSNSSSTIKKLLLTTIYIVPILYYVITESKRFMKYIKKK